jgi:hypothetical protein
MLNGNKRIAKETIFISQHEQYISSTTAIHEKNVIEVSHLILIRPRSLLASS